MVVQSLKKGHEKKGAFRGIKDKKEYTWFREQVNVRLKIAERLPARKLRVSAYWVLGGYGLQHVTGNKGNLVVQI